ncbi:similar to Yarrowia lipolytica YALI0E18722p [Yarrowia lipolytica CLIB122], partial (Partial), partial [Geotrichum candidum]
MKFTTKSLLLAGIFVTAVAASAVADSASESGVELFVRQDSGCIVPPDQSACLSRCTSVISTILTNVLNVCSLLANLTDAISGCLLCGALFPVVNRLITGVVLNILLGCGISTDAPTNEVCSTTIQSSSTSLPSSAANSVNSATSTIDGSTSTGTDSAVSSVASSTVSSGSATVTATNSASGSDSATATGTNSASGSGSATVTATNSASGSDSAIATATNAATCVEAPDQSQCLSRCNSIITRITSNPLSVCSVLADLTDSISGCLLCGALFPVVNSLISGVLLTALLGCGLSTQAPAVSTCVSSSVASTATSAAASGSDTATNSASSSGSDSATATATNSASGSGSATATATNSA